MGICQSFLLNETQDKNPDLCLEKTLTKSCSNPHMGLLNHRMLCCFGGDLIVKYFLVLYAKIACSKCNTLQWNVDYEYPYSNKELQLLSCALNVLSSFPCVFRNQSKGSSA